MRKFIITRRLSRAARSTRSQSTRGSRLKTYLSRFSNRVFGSDPVAQNPPSQYPSDKGSADGANSGLGFYKIPESDSKWSILPYHDADDEARFRSLSSWKLLLK